MTVRCECCGVVKQLKKHDGEYLCPDCIQCEISITDSVEAGGGDGGRVLGDTGGDDER